MDQKVTLSDTLTIDEIRNSERVKIGFDSIRGCRTLCIDITPDEASKLLVIPSVKAVFLFANGFAQVKYDPDFDFSSIDENA